MLPGASLALALFFCFCCCFHLLKTAPASSSACTRACTRARFSSGDAAHLEPLQAGLEPDRPRRALLVNHLLLHTRRANSSYSERAVQLRKAPCHVRGSSTCIQKPTEAPPRSPTMAAITRPTCSLLGGAISVQSRGHRFVHTEHPQTLSGRGGALDLVTGASTVAASGCQRGGTVCRDTLSCAGAGPLVCTGIPASAGLTLAFGPDTGRRGRSGGYAAYPHRNAGRGTAADGRRWLRGPTTPIWAAGALVRALIGRRQTASSGTLHSANYRHGGPGRRHSAGAHAAIARRRARAV